MFLAQAILGEKMKVEISGSRNKETKLLLVSYLLGLKRWSWYMNSRCGKLTFGSGV